MNPIHTTKTADIAAIIAYVSALSGLITNVFGAIAAVASALWCCYRFYDYLKQRKAQP